MKKILITCMLISMSATVPFACAEDSAQTLKDETVQSVDKEQSINKFDRAKYDKLCNEAKVLIEKKKYSQAEGVLQKAIALNPDLDMAYAQKARIYNKQKKYKEARIEAQKALKINDKNKEANIAMGQVLSNIDKDYQNALNYFNKVLEMQSNDVIALCNIAHTYGKMSEYKKAIEYFTKALSDTTTDDLIKQDIYKSRALLYFIIGENDLADKDIDIAIKLNSKDYEAYSIKGKILANKGKTLDAIKYSDKAIKLSKGANKAGLYLDRIYVYQKMGRSYYSIKDDFQLAEKYAGNDTFYLNMLARNLIDFEKNDEACRIYKKILEIDSSDHAATLNLVAALLNMKNYSQAKTVLEDFKKNNSNLVDTDERYKKNYYTNIAMAKFGMAQLNNKELINEAVKDLKTADNAKKDYFLANGYFILGDYKNAFEYYKRKIEANNSYGFNETYKLLMLKKLASYDGYDKKTRSWAVPDWFSNYTEKIDLDWNMIANEIKNDPIARVNYANGAGLIEDKNYILSTIQMLRSKNYGVGKVYNLHIDDEAYGNTSRIVAFPYINTLDDKATSISDDDYNLILANQYYLLINNSLMHMPKYYSINETDVSNFFSAIEKIPSKTALDIITDLTDLSLAQWDMFDNKGVSLYFYNEMISYLKSKNLDKSSKEIKEHIKSIYLGMGDYYRKEKGIEEAMHYYNSAIPYGASAFEINKYIGDYYFSEDNYFKAIDYFTKALSAKNDAEIYLKRGYSKSKLKDYDGALYDYNKAIGYNKNLKLAYWERAQILFKQKKFSTALNDYLKYSSFDKKDASAQYNAAICLYNTGKKQQALPYLDRAKSLAQSSGETQLYNKSIQLINEIKGYNRRYY